MANYTAVYRERDDGDFDLMLIVSQEFLDDANGQEWLDTYASEGIDGVSKVVEGDDLSEFPDVWSEPQGMSFDAWEEQYKPVKNPYDPKAAHGGCMFEVHGEDYAYVVLAYSKGPGKIWTLIDTDGNQTIESGFHIVNRMGYFITEVDAPDDSFVSVVL